MSQPGPVDSNSSTIFAPVQISLPALAEPPSADFTKSNYLQAIGAYDYSRLPQTTSLLTQAISRPPVPETSALSINQPEASNHLFSSQSISSPSDFIVFTNATVQVPSGSKSLVNEPSVANKDNVVFYTGNWYAARSDNGGAAWSYRDPSSDMSDFCCDQDVVYNPNRSIFLWYRQALKDSNGDNRIRLGVSSDAETWYFYDTHPYEVNSEWTGRWFDYPTLAFSDNYLYITTNVYRETTYTNSVILRLPLDSLRDRQAFTYRYHSDSFGTFAPVQGASNIMYWATHIGPETLRLYSWDELSDSISRDDIRIPPYSLTLRGEASCPTPDGGDICARTDDRILGGWIAKGVIGFLWNVKQGGGYPYPYIYLVRIAGDTKAFLDNPVIWNRNAAWIYGWVAPNARGHLGMVAFTAGPFNNPKVVIGINDDFSGAPPPWEFYGVALSTNGPDPSCRNGTTNDCWGDYVRVRPFNGNGNVWIASGYTLQGGRTGNYVVPGYLVFGRARDVFQGHASITGDQYYSSSGDVSLSSNYPNGVLLSGGLDSGISAWALTVSPPSPCSYDLLVGARYTDQSLFGNGPDLLLYNRQGSAWDTIAVMPKGADQNPRYAVSLYSYTTSSGMINIQISAGSLDNTDVDYVEALWFYDTVPPENPHSFSADHGLSRWSSDNTIFVSWSGSTDDRSGISSYSIEWSKSTTTIPDTMIDITSPQTTSPPLSDSATWYLHIRAIDECGNAASGAFHIGPFQVDATPPPPPVPDDGVSGWSQDSTPTFVWNAPADLSGIVGYSFAIDQQPDNTLDTASTSITLPTQPDGSHTFYVKAQDFGGNWGRAGSHTFYIDLRAPITLNNYDGLWHNNDLRVILTAQDDGSGVAATYYRINGASIKSVGVEGQALISTEGSDNRLEYWSLDIAGNEEEPHRILTGIKLDKTAPTGSIEIKNDTYTISTSVVLTLTAADSFSGIHRVRYSNDGVWDSELWEAFGPTKAWALAPRDGIKNVYYQIIDNAGSISRTFSDDIILDLLSPTGSIIVNNDARHTTSISVTLTLTATDITSGVGQVRYSNDGAWSNEPWEDYQPSKSWTLTPGDGIRRVYYQVMDNAGWISDTFFDEIVMDTLGPTGSIAVNEEAPYTKTATVILALSADDSTSGVAEMRFSNDDTSYSDWQLYGLSKSWNAEPGDGAKTVYVQFRDSAGLVSQSYFDTIVLDATPPVANAGSELTVIVGTAVAFDGSASLDNFEVSGYEWDFGDGQAASGKTVTHKYAVEGTYTVTLSINDSAGNLASHSITITVTPVQSAPARSSEGLPSWIVYVALALVSGIATAIILRKRKKRESLPVE